MAARPAPSDAWPQTTRLLPWALALFLAMVWLIPFDSTELPVSLPLGAKLDRPFLMLIVALWLLSLTSLVGASRLRLSPVHWALYVLLLVAVISLLLNGDTLVRLGEMELALRKLALLVSFALLFVIVASAVRAEEVRNFIVFMIGLAAVASVGALIEYRTGYNAFFSWAGTVLPVGHPEELGAIDSIGRKSIVGPTIHPLAISMMMTLALPFALVGLLSSSERRSKILYAIAAGLMVAAALATQRKTSVVAPAFGVLVLLAYRPRAMLRLVPIAFLLFALIQVAAPGALGGVTDQLKPNNLFGVLSTKDRQSDYSAIRPDVIKHPLLGRGYESYDQKKYRILDNQYLTLVIGTGALGVLAFLGVFIAAFLVAHRLARADDSDMAGIGVAAAAVMASVVVGSALLDTLALPQVAYLICFVAGLVVVAAQAQPRAAPAPAPAPAPAGRAGAAQGSLLRPRLLSD